MLDWFRKYSENIPKGLEPARKDKSVTRNFAALNREFPQFKLSEIRHSVVQLASATAEMLAKGEVQLGASAIVIGDRRVVTANHCLLQQYPILLILFQDAQKEFCLRQITIKKAYNEYDIAFALIEGSPTSGIYPVKREAVHLEENSREPLVGIGHAFDRRQLHAEDGQLYGYQKLLKTREGINHLDPMCLMRVFSGMSGGGLFWNGLCVGMLVKSGHAKIMVDGKDIGPNFSGSISIDLIRILEAEAFSEKPVRRNWEVLPGSPPESILVF